MSEKLTLKEYSYIFFGVIFMIAFAWAGSNLIQISNHQPTYDFFSGDNYLKCKWTEWRNNDSYCNKEMPIDFIDSYGNKYYNYDFYFYVIRYHSIDKINEENALKEAQRQKEIADAYKSNYDAGYDVFEKYDIINDHNFSCKQIEYINDHFITTASKEDAGYINGRYSGFLSHGWVEGQMYQWVYSQILATGQLAESVSYHVMGDNTTIDKKIDYYTTSEFVMYYVNHCIEE